MGLPAGLADVSVNDTVKGIAPLWDGEMVKSATGHASALPMVNRYIMSLAPFDSRHTIRFPDILRLSFEVDPDVWVTIVSDAGTAVSFRYTSPFSIQTTRVPSTSAEK